MQKTSQTVRGGPILYFCIEGCELGYVQREGFILFCCTIHFFFLNDLKEKEGRKGGYTGGHVG
jgi:hypothetical protein